MRLKKILFILLFLILTFIALFTLWWNYIFFPDDYNLTREEAIKTEATNDSQVIDVSLIGRLEQTSLTGDFSKKRISKIINQLISKGFLIKDDPYIKSRKKNLCFRFGTGMPGIWVDERSSIILPHNCKISFQEVLEGSPILDFSIISPLDDGQLIIDVLSDDGKKIRKSISIKNYKQTNSQIDAAIQTNNRGYKKAEEDTGWKNFSIDLSEMTGDRTTISFSTRSNGALFIANPRIFKHEKKRRYNVIYLVFDGVATRHWSFYNEKSKLTPFMKQIADNECIVFDNMFTLGNKTRISTAGLFTSVMPFDTRHGINRNYIPENEKERFYKLIRQERLLSLPDIYRKKGYITEQFGNSGFTVHLISTGVDYGFERSYEFSFNPYDSYGISHQLFKFLRQNKDREFFLYLHYNTPHKPFYAPLKYFFKGIINAPLEALWRPAFMGCISYTDDVFKNIYSALKANDLLQNTILVIATDHGAGYDLKKYDKGFQYNDYTRLSFMMRLPDTIKNNLGIKKNRIETYISSINISPTLIDLSGMNKASQFKGQSFLDLLRSEVNKEFFDDKIWCFGRKTMSLITNNEYKYILTYMDAKKHVDWQYLFFGEQKEMPFEEIYNLKEDPFETKNLIHQNRELLAKFRRKYLESDIHHPERTVIAFFPNNSIEKKTIDIEINSRSRILDVQLYNEKLKPLNKLKILNPNRFLFKIKKDPLYFIFENEKDREPISIFIKSNGSPVKKNRIYATNLDLNIFNNPIILKTREDFLILNSTDLPRKNQLINSKNELTVKISRLDLHRWIDIGNIDNMGINAGMKETLKSWGYIQ